MGIYIIAEAGVNHNGEVSLAMEMIDKAKESGCDCVKFQTFKTDKLVTRKAKKAEYQIKNTQDEDSQFEMLQKLELSYNDFYVLKKYCDEVGIDFLSTPFDEETADMLEKLCVSAYKLSSGDITNKRLIEYVAEKNHPMILSTGMCNMEEVKEAVGWIENTGNRQITLLHCTSNYPTPYDEVNMSALMTLRDEFPYPVGYSDHTEGIVIPIMSATLGATVIEKHFTLDREMPGPDHKASLNPHELKEMVDQIRIVERAFGDGKKVPTASEMSTRDVARKSIVVNKALRKGSVLRGQDLDIKRPGTGIEPKYIEDLIGCRLLKDVEEEELLMPEDISRD